MELRVGRPRSSFGRIGLAIVGGLILVAVMAPLIAPGDPRALTGRSLEPPSSRHLLGTNDIGQDILSEVVWGARSSLVVGIGGATLSTLLGVLVGAGAALLGGRIGSTAMRVVDVFLAVPVLPLLILVAALAGPSQIVVLAITGVLGWPGAARVVRSQALSLRQRGFVEAASGFGGGPWYVLRRHLVPALAPLIAAAFVNWAGVAISLEAGLAFLGLGDPTGISWGLVLNRALDHPGLFFGSAWIWWVLPAGSAITLAVMGFTFLGISLEPRSNPRWATAA